MPRSHPEYERGFTDGFNSKQRDVDQLLAEVARLREAVRRAEWDFTALVEVRGDLADESRAHETLRILRAALSSEKEEQIDAE